MKVVSVKHSSHNLKLAAVTCQPWQDFYVLPTWRHKRKRHFNICWCMFGFTVMLLPNIGMLYLHASFGLSALQDWPISAKWMKGVSGGSECNDKRLPILFFRFILLAPPPFSLFSSQIWHCHVNIMNVTIWQDTPAPLPHCDRFKLQPFKLENLY